MKAHHYDTENQATPKPVSDNEAASTPRPRKVLPAPGKPLSFEEALKLSNEENKELLHRLAQ